MDLKDLILLAIPKIVPEFGNLTTDELALLRKMEADKAEPERRTTLLDAIDAEAKARVDAAELDEKTKTVIDLAKEQGVELVAKADYDALAARVAELEKLSVAAAKKAAKVEPVAKAEKPVTIKQAKDMGKLVGPFVTVAFSDADDVTLPGLPQLTFEQGQFVRIGGRSTDVLLNADIEFPEGGLRGDVAKVWWLDAKGAGIAACVLVKPLPVGGGARARMPAKSLVFTPAAAFADDAE